MKSTGILLLREIPPPSLHEIYASIQGDGTNYPSFSFHLACCIGTNALPPARLTGNVRNSDALVRGS